MMHFSASKFVPLISAAAMCALIPSAALGQTPEEAEQAQPDSDAKPDGPKAVCKRIRETGTRFTTEVCKTREEWLGIRTEMREVAEDFRRQERDFPRRNQSQAPEPEPGPR